MGELGDFRRMSTDFVRHEAPIGEISGHGAFIGGEYSAFTVVSIPFVLFDSFMISKGGDLIKGWMERDSFQKTLNEIYKHISISILYISTKISTNYVRREFLKLFEDKNFEFRKGFLRKFFSIIVNQYMNSLEK